MKTLISSLQTSPQTPSNRAVYLPEIRCEQRPPARNIARQAGVFLAALAVSGLLLSPVPLPASETDENLEASARGAYVFRRLLSEEGIAIEVSNGTVTLRGTVESAIQRELAEEAAAALHGVRSVDNQIALKPVAEADADALLARTVRTVLAWHRSARGVAAKLEVKEGIVTLRGEAESTAARDLAAEYAAGIEGVRSVKNELLAKHPDHEETTPQKQEDCCPEATVSPTEATAGVDDPSVAAQARMALRFHLPTRRLKVGLEVSEGLLTLTGEAPTDGERQAAGRLCADIHGVRKVLNKMTLEPEQTQN